MNIVNYLYPNILEDSWSLYSKDIKEYIDSNQSEFILSQKRDNCGIAAVGFYFFMKNKNIDFTRVRGDFVTDLGVYTKLDFYKTDLQEMKKIGLNVNSLEDRMKYVEEFNLHDRQKRIPHYWNVDSNGLIVDLSGYSQFVKTGLAKDLNPSRYEVEKPNIENKFKYG